MDNNIRLNTYYPGHDDEEWADCLLSKKNPYLKGNKDMTELNTHDAELRVGDLYYDVTRIERCDDMLWYAPAGILRAIAEIDHHRAKSKFAAPTQTIPGIKKVIFNNPATIILWEDGTKTVVKCGEYDTFDPEKGVAMAISKKYFGNNEGYYAAHFKKPVNEYYSKKYRRFFDVLDKFQKHMKNLRFGRGL